MESYTKFLILEFLKDLSEGTRYDLKATPETVENVNLILSNLAIIDDDMSVNVAEEVDSILLGANVKSGSKWINFFALTIASIISRDAETQSLINLSKQQANGKVTGKN